LVWTRWDSKQALRAAFVAALALALALLVTAATDEGGVPWRERVGRTLPLAPLCATVGAWAALAPVRARGDVVALEALGRPPVQIAASAVMGGALLALIAAFVVGFGIGAVDAAGFFPTATHASGWTWDGSGFVDHEQGLRIGAEGSPEVVLARGSSSFGAAPPYGRASAAVATALAGLALPWLLATDSRRTRGRTLAGVGAGLAASIACFQASAAHRMPAWLGIVPALALLAFAARRAQGQARVPSSAGGLR
jgi:hypothetical protein